MTPDDHQTIFQAKLGICNPTEDGYWQMIININQSLKQNRLDYGAFSFFFFTKIKDVSWLNTKDQKPYQDKELNSKKHTQQIQEVRYNQQQETSQDADEIAAYLKKYVEEVNDISHTSNNN